MLSQPLDIWELVWVVWSWSYVS